MENEYVKGTDRADSLKPWYPLLGLLLMIAMGMISFVLSEPLHELLAEQVFTNSSDFEREEMRYVVGGSLFMILIMLGSSIFAAFAPKPEKMASDAQLKKERVERKRERDAKRRRRKKINTKMAAERKAAEKAATGKK